MTNIPPRVTPEQVSAGLRAFFATASKWKLTDDQAMTLLGQPAKATFLGWKRGDCKSVSLTLDLATRLSFVLGIFKALEIIYQTPELADRWVTAPNRAIGGETAIQRMMTGQIADLAAVRDYLDSIRGGQPECVRTIRRSRTVGCHFCVV